MTKAEAMDLIDKRELFKHLLEQRRTALSEKDWAKASILLDIVGDIMDFPIVETDLRSEDEGRTTAWISVKDRLPREEDDVILRIREVEHYGRHGEKRIAYSWIFTGWCVDGRWATTYCHGHRYISDENEHDPKCVHTVTHWMPLPEPPEDTKDEEAEQ